MRQELVQNGADVILGTPKREAAKHKCLTAHKLRNEAEGSRTLNLRIDSPML